MRFTVAQSDFLEAFNRVAPAVPSKTTLPILSNILLQLEGNKLLLLATDLEVSVLTELEVQGHEDGSLSIPAKKIGDIVRELDAFDIEFESDEGNHLQLTAGEGNYQVPGIAAQEFPSLPEFEESSSIIFEAGVFKDMIDRTSFAVSKDELRPALTGVFLQLRSQEFRAVATDGHRLVRIIDQNFSYSDEPREIIIPVKALSMVSRNLPEEGEISLAIGTNQIMVKLENATLYSRLIEGKYPHYESVIPTNNSDLLVVSVEALIKTVKRAQIFSNPISRQIVFNLQPNRLDISAEDVELGGRGSETISVAYDGEEKTIGYNSIYILELLKHIKTDQVRFELGSSTQAGITRPTEQREGEDFLMLIMPVRLS